MKRSRVLPALVALAIVLCPVLARAALDADSADKDTHALLTTSDYTFCSKPDHPLSQRARALCPLAGEVPGCSALVTECADVEPKPPELGPFWQGVFAFLGRIAPYAAWAVVGLLVLVVVYLIVRAILAGREDVVEIVKDVTTDVTDVADSAPDAPSTPAEALLRLAAIARSRGDRRTALVTYLAAALRALGDRGSVRLARDRTNGEYVRGCKESAAKGALRVLVRDVDGVQFGGGEATDDVLDHAASRAQEIVRGGVADLARLAGTAVMLLAVVLLTGACGGRLGGGHDDPSGHDLLTDLLAKQGATVGTLPGSIAGLPMKGPEGPVLILDAERVPLEDESRDHLVAWVKQGGVLVLAGDPSRWPPAFWAKRILSDCTSGPVTVTVETRGTPKNAPRSEVHHARLSQTAAMTWPNEDHAPRVIAHYESGDLYAALRSFGDGRILGMASPDLLSNVGLAVPGNPASVVAMLASLDRTDFVIARPEQGIAPPSNPFAGLIHIGLGPALLQTLFFIPLLFLAYGVRQSAPRVSPPPRRRAFAEHVRATGALYAERRAATHALAVYAKHVDDRLRALMPRGGDPAQFLATRARVPREDVAELYARAIGTKAADVPRGDELTVLQKLALAYARAVARR